VIQRVGDMEVMHYRGRLIPLLRLSSIVPVAEITEDKRGTTVQVVVCSAGGHTVGLLVDRIVDIVEQTSALESVQRRHGVTGTCMINRKVTDVLDIPAIVSAAVPDSLAAAAGQES
jgi:two-component system chemotaxis sensor kinase CheA